MNALGIDIGGTSVKLAMLRDSEPIWTERSGIYTRPTTEKLIDSIREAASGRDVCADAIGLCVPGILDKKSRIITLSVNVPGLMGVPLDDLLRQAGPAGPGPAHITNDALAAATDFHALHMTHGRLLAIVIGAGVGGAVLDDDKPLFLDGESPGHIGMIDVSIPGHDVVGPDGGAGSLEGYLGAKFIRSTDGLDESSPPIHALVRAIRICHAIYRPNHIALLGGIGIRLKSKIEMIRSLVNENLTSVARSNWTLQSGDDDFHAARGAARIAMKLI